MNKRIFYLLITSAILVSLVYVVFVRSAASEELNRYEYKITPKDATWKNFKTHEEMVSACRIPVEIVNKMTTEQIVDAVMDYPLLLDVLAFNSNEESVQSLLSISDAFKELTTRTDSKKYLVKKISYFTKRNLPEDSLNIKVIDILLTEENLVFH